MKTHKLNMTRPEFLKKFLTDSDDTSTITEEDLERIIPGSTNLLYAAYTVIRELDLRKSSITYVNSDEESIVMKMESKELAKQIKDEFNKEQLRIGAVVYKIHVKVDKTYVFISIEEDHRLDTDVEE